MKSENFKKVFINSVLILLGFIFGLGISVFAWMNPSQNPPLGGGVLQTGTSGLKIVTTTQITLGNFTVNNGNVGIGTTTPAQKLTVAGNIDVAGNRIVNLASPIDSTDAATKGYVDAQSGGGAAFPSGILQPFADSNPRPGWTYTGFYEARGGGDTWTTKTPMTTPRFALAAVAVNNVIYAIGGYNSSGYLTTNEAYDPATNSWTTKTPMTTPRAALAAAAVDNIIYAIGGYNNSSGWLSINEAYIPFTNSWTTQTPMTTPRAGFAAAVVNNRIYAIGGYNSSGYLATNEAYDPSANTWTTKAQMPTPRKFLAAGAVDNIIYAIGGWNGGYLATNEAYDPSANTWTTKAQMPTPRSTLAAAVVNNRIYAIGGQNDSGLLSTNEVYDPFTNTWATRAPMSAPRYHLAAAAANNIIYAIGGASSGSMYVSTNEAYTPPGLILYWFQKQ